MVKLTRKERKCVEILERRLAHLSKRVETIKDYDVSWDVTERRAILWALEVVQHAAAMNFEEPFLYTGLRQRVMSDTRRVANYLEQCVERTKQQKVEQELKLVARYGLAGVRSAPGEH